MRSPIINRIKPIGSIHTFEMTADNLIDTEGEDYITLIRITNKPDSSTGYRYTYKVNLNKIKLIISENNPLDDDNPARLEITTYSEHKAALDYLMQEQELINPVITRIDFRFDEYDLEYTQLYKLAKFLTLLIADYYSISNIFESKDPIKIILETIRAQSDNFEIEFYNKAEQAPKYNIKSRLELRAKKLYTPDSGKVQSELAKCIERLYTVIDKKCIVKGDNGEQMTEVQRLLTRINNGLLRQYAVDKAKGETVYISEFIHEYRASFFTTAQLVDFYERAGVNNAKIAVSKYKHRRKLELYELSDLRAYVDKISAAADRFIDN